MSDPKEGRGNINACLEDPQEAMHSSRLSGEATWWAAAAAEKNDRITHKYYRSKIKKNSNKTKTNK